MKRLLSSLSTMSTLNRIILPVFIILFLFLVVQTPIISSDTKSYSMMEISRFPGFVLFLRVFKIVFRENYPSIMIGFNLVFGFSVIHIVLHKLKSLFKLELWQNLIVFAILLFPYFPPLSIAANITSEAIAYPLYLLMIMFGLEILMRSQHLKIFLFALAYLGLVLTRGQFIIIPFIFLFILLLKYKKAILQPTLLGILILLIILPVLSVQIDKTYRKVFFGHFVSTPYSYINSIALPLYISKKEDRDLFETEDQRKVFDLAYKRIDSLNLLSSKVKGSRMERFAGFYYNFPLICNQNIHDQGIQYYMDQNHSRSESYIRIENDCKAMMPLLIKHNFKEYITLYYTNVIQGFKSIFIAIFLFVVLCWSGISLLKRYETNKAVIFLITLLIFSNAFIVGIACHSIIRYIFYNYFLFFILIILLFRKKHTTHESY